MQNSTETPRTIASQYIQNKGGRDSCDELDSESRVFVGNLSLPNTRNMKTGMHAMLPNAHRQFPKKWANHPTSRGADVANSEAITFASESATAFLSACRSASAAGTRA